MPRLPSSYQRVIVYSAVSISVLLVIALLGGVAIGVWMPDLLGDSQWIYEGKVGLTNGDALHVLQWPDGLFYATCILWESGDGSRRCFLVDVDDGKVWTWSVTIYGDNELATLRLGRGRVYMWDINNRKLRGTKGLLPYEPVEDGSPFAPFPDFPEDLMCPRVVYES